MKLYCAWHKKYFPEECDGNGDYYIREKEPLDNPLRTDGMCPDCSRKANKEIEEYKEDVKMSK